jgi:hypothetical protein
MPTLANQTKQDYKATGKLWQRAALALNSLARFVNAFEFAWPLTVDPSGEGNRVSVDPQAGSLSIPVLLTAAPDGDAYYRGSVYGLGIEEDPTATDQKIRLVNCDVVVDGEAPQGFYDATAKLDEETGEFIYQVVVNLPKGEASGQFIPTLIDGVLTWVDAVAAAGPGFRVIPVLLTAEPSGDAYYRGRVYDNGTNNGYTAVDQKIFLNGFNVQVDGIYQSYYYAVKTLRGGDTVYEVWRNGPVAPASGWYGHEARDGQERWLAVVDCGGDGYSSGGGI